ncbi:hypothetical protein EZV62_011902 [Acer yangbiense]|uniref:Uncharacterized protein n=1 Tax=Acer yangbiense TaxID=1000413 RepID=A0A5C7I784_9ROSI|nr:hypothetical protein EZV62_011902 [Acer yangbiense]
MVITCSVNCAFSIHCFVIQPDMIPNCLPNLLANQATQVPVAGENALPRYYENAHKQILILCNDLAFSGLWQLVTLLLGKLSLNRNYKVTVSCIYYCKLASSIMFKLLKLGSLVSCDNLDADYPERNP